MYPRFFIKRVIIGGSAFGRAPHPPMMRYVENIPKTAEHAHMAGAPSWAGEVAQRANPRVCVDFKKSPINFEF